MASAESTEARLITQPTERSMPAPMMTKVCPRPSNSTGVIATRMFCELRTVRKLTEPLFHTGTAITKNAISVPRKTQAHILLSVRMNRMVVVSFEAGGPNDPLAAALVSGPAKFAFPHKRQQTPHLAGRTAGERSASAPRDA